MGKEHLLKKSTKFELLRDNEEKAGMLVLEKLKQKKASPVKQPTITKLLPSVYSAGDDSMFSPKGC